MGPAARRARTSTCPVTSIAKAKECWAPAVATFTRIRAVLTEYVEASHS